jgi:hypothetical protein
VSPRVHTGKEGEGNPAFPLGGGYQNSRTKSSGRVAPPATFIWADAPYPFTQTTCFRVWTTSTRSLCAAITASMSL